MSDFLLNICSFGDPTSPSTWSGTPYRVCSELRRMGKCGATFCIQPRHSIQVLLSMLSLPLYGARDLARSPLRRYACSCIAARNTHRSSSTHTLHMGSFALPFLNRPADQKHYLLCDSTWNLWSHHSTNMAGYSVRLRSAAESLEQRAYAQVDHIFAISHYVKDDLLDHYRVPNEKVTVVGTGPGAIKPFHGTKDYSNGNILFTAKGRFRDKGGELVLAAFQKAFAVNPRLSLTIVGQHDYLSLKPSPGIRVLGHVSIETLQELFNTHTLFLMPALNEPWGLVYLEAMLCKMPIMGLDRNGFPELSGHGKFGFSIATATDDEIAAQILYAFSDPGELQKMGEMAQKHCAKAYSWESTVATITNTIQAKYA